MSTTIDQRVVEMRFDNKQFESNVQTSLGTIDKLNKSLDMTGAAKGLENVNAAARNFNVSPLSSGIESIQAKFSALEVMAVTALANITNSAVNAGKKLVSAFTIDPIKTGFQEYETQINAVQTILANTESKGTTLDDVNKALDTLNTYADKTIYNFTEMTRNIGTFTAAGIDLDTSVTAIQGIANLAAVSGSTSQQASTAMYQLSQALSSGTVKLQDWNSVVNAGMGGQVFQDALKETARAHGIAIDQMIKDEGSFRETLQNGWLTSEVLTETLSKFTMATEGLTEAEIEKNREMLKGMGYTDEQIEGIFKLGNTATNAATKVKTFTQLMDTLKEAAQSGWTQTWEILVGDFEEAKELMTSISDYFGEIIGKSADARNKVLQNWKDAGGRTMLIDSIKNAFDGLLSIIKPIKEAFREIFPPITAKNLLDFTKGLKDLTAKFKLNSEQSEKLKNVFKGLFSIIDVGVRIIKAVVSGAVKLIGHMSGLGDVVLTVAGTLGEWQTSLRNVIAENDIFGRGVDIICNAVQKAVDKIKEFFSVTKTDFSVPGFDNFLNVLNSIWSIIKKVGSKIAEAGSYIVKAISGAFASGDISSTALNMINGGLLAGALLSIKKIIDSFSDAFDGFGSILEGVTGVLDGVKGSLEAWQGSLKADTLMKIAAAIAILAAALVVLSFVDPDKLVFALGAVGGLFAELMGSFKLFGKLSGELTGVTKSVMVMIGMSTAVLILASALKTIADLEWEELAKGLVGVAGLMAILLGVVTAMSKLKTTGIKGAASIVIFAAAIKILASVCTDLSSLSWEELGKGLTGVGVLIAEVAAFMVAAKFTGNVMKGAANIVIFAAAIKILASACIDLSTLSWEGLAKGLVGVGVLIAEIAVFMNTAKFSGKAMITAIGIVLLASAIKILASACKDFSGMSWEEIGKGLASVGALLAEIAIFTNVTGNAKHVISTGAALVLIGAAMKIFTSSVMELATLSWEELGRGLLGMAGALTAVTVAMRLMPNNTIGIGVGLIAVSAALSIVADVLGKMSGMSWEEIAKGLVTLGGSMAVLAVGLNFMKGTMGASAALLVAAAAFGVLTPILKTLGSMSWEEIIRSFVALAGALTIFGAAAALLGPVAGSMAVVGAAVLLFGAGCALAGAGILAVSIALTSLSASLVVVAASIVEILKIVISGLGDLIVMLCDAVIASAPAIAKAIVSLIESVCYAIEETVPLIVDTVLKLCVELLDMLKTYIPQIVDILIDIIVDLIDSLTARTPELVGSLANFVKALMDSLDEALGAGGWEKLLMSIGTVSAIFLALSGASKIISTIPISGALKGIAGLAIVVAGMAAILAALGGLAQIPGFEWIISEGTRVLGQIGRAIGEFVGEILGGLAVGATNGLPELGNNLTNFMTNIQPFIDGVRNIDESMFSGIGALTGAIMKLTAADLVSSITSFLTGGSSFSKLGEELAAFGPQLKTYADSVDGINASAIENSATALGALAEMSRKIPNEGGLAAWFAGDNTLAAFGPQISAFGGHLKTFSDSVAGVNPENVVAAANAAQALAEMADTVPNEGGVVAWFSGDNSLASFGAQISAFGGYLKEFSDNVAGINPDDVTEAARAAISLSEMADTIPNEGGVVAWFTGDNSLASFGPQISAFGGHLKTFSDSVAGVNPENVVAAANAGKALATMADTIPNEGGVVAWFTGENSLASFGPQISAFGGHLKTFSDNVSGINPENVLAAANAGKALADMANIIPNEGGVVAWFTGDNSLASFGPQIATFGASMKEFSDNVSGIEPESVVAAANAGKALAEMASVIPNEGGVVAWFTGENSLASFGPQISAFGGHLKTFSDNVSGINPENVLAASEAGKTLAEMASLIPNEGGVASWFAGDNSLASFGPQIATFGEHMKTFSNNVSGIDIEAVKVASEAGKTLAEMADTIPNEGGVASWFAGDNSLASFGPQIATFGEHMKTFSDNVSGINPENVLAASEAGKTLAEMADTIPNEGGVVAWFTGEGSLATFGPQIATFGEHLKTFSDNVSGIKPENVTAAANAGKALAEMANTIPDTGGIASWFSGDNSMADFGPQIAEFGKHLKDFSTNVAGINSNNVTAAANAGKTLAGITIPKNVDFKSFGKQISELGSKLSDFSSHMDGANVSGSVDQVKKIVNMAKDISAANDDSISSFGKALASMAKDGVDKFVKAFKDGYSKVKNAVNDFVKTATSAISDKKQKFNDAGKTSMKSFVNGLTANKNNVSKECKSMAGKGADAIKDKQTSYCNAGKYLVDGFCNGITDRTWKAEAKARAMAEAALEAAEEALGINSPSKEFYKIGAFTGEGFINALGDYSSKIGSASADMALEAKSGFGKAVSKIVDAINIGFDTQPTIRPVLDLSSVESGVGAINGMFNMNPSVGVLSNVGTINSMMNESQNGGNSDFISAIKELGNKIGKASGDTYNINGVTYDDGSNISSAVKTLVRAAKVERRT